MSALGRPAGSCWLKLRAAVAQEGRLACALAGAKGSTPRKERWLTPTSTVDVRDILCLKEDLLCKEALRGGRRPQRKFG